MTLTRIDILAAEELEGRALLIKFCEHYKQTGTVPEEIMAELYARFQDILLGDEPNSALGPMRPEGRQPKTANEVDKVELPIAVEIQRYIDAGMAVKKAVSEVLRKHYKICDRRTIRRIYNDNKSAAQMVLAIERKHNPKNSK